VEALGVIGSAEVCARKIEQFVAAGIQLPIVMPFTPEASVAAGYLRTVGALSASGCSLHAARGV